MDVWLEPAGIAGPWGNLLVGGGGLLALRNLRSTLPVPCAPLALDDDELYGFTVGSVRQALKGRGWTSLWQKK